MHGGDELWPVCLWELTPGQPGNPCRDPGTKVENIGLLLSKEASQCRYLPQGKKAFFMNAQGDMTASFTFELRDKAASMGNDDRFVAMVDQVFGDLKCAALDAAGIEFREYLENLHGGSFYFLKKRSTMIVAQRAASSS